MNILWCEGFPWNKDKFLKGLSAWEGVVKEAIVVTEPDIPGHDANEFLRMVVQQGKKIGVRVSAGLKIDPFALPSKGMETLVRWSVDGYPCPGPWLLFDFETPFHGNAKRGILGYKKEKEETRKEMRKNLSAFMGSLPKFKRVREIILYPTIYSPGNDVKTLLPQLEVMDELKDKPLRLFDESIASPKDQEANHYGPPIWRRLLDWYKRSLIEGMYCCDPAGGRTFWTVEAMAEILRTRYLLKTPSRPFGPDTLIFPGIKRMEEVGLMLKRLLK